MTGALAAMLARRTPRERFLAAAALAVAGVWVAAAAVWQPLLAGRAALEADLLRIGRLQAAAARLAPQPGGTAPPPVVDDRPPAVIATATAADMGLGVRRLDPQGAAGVQVTLEDAAFDLVLLWIAALETDHGLRLTDLHLTRQPAPGSVSASLTLER